jgi:hypothetical protein
MRPTGLVILSRIVDARGREVPLERAIVYGWVRPGAEAAKNIFVDQGRQCLAYAFAFRSPISNFVCQKYGVGTGRSPAKVTDVALQAPLALASASGQYTAPVDSIDFLSAFVVRVAFTIALGDANGSLITEMGLFTGNDTLIARRVRTVGINKTSDYSPTFTWNLRF